MPYWTSVGLMLRACWPLVLGNTLEWYEFSTYGYLIPELQENFFRGSSVLAWIGFAITFVMRPLGGVVLGWLADRFGRKVGVITSLAGMIGATVLQGCLPSHLTSTDSILPTIGLVLMVLCRISQGLFAGGEISGVSVTLGEHETRDCLGMAAATISFGGSLAFFLSSGIVGILHAVLSPQQMLLWGWRIPFIITVVPGLLALLLRLDLPETDAFVQLVGKEEAHVGSMQHLLATLHTVFCKYTGASLISVLGCAAISTLWYVGPIYSSNFVVKHCGMDSSTALSIASFAQLFAMALTPLVGWLTDRIGVGKVMVLGAGFIAVCGLPVYFALIESHGDPVVVAVMVIGVFGTAQGLAGTTVYLWALELFETSVRTTGMGFTYNLAVSYFGGCAPIVVDLLAERGALYAPGLAISLAGVLSTATLLTSRWLHSQQRIQLTHLRHFPY
eukprot:GGOE01045720.1.p1 GENE.GGOE01045720.1~~GGOE01045720.1.p1  ORF type:complete len:446 (-),score=115.15 GGOE01045720.1:329-1666(-)